MMAGMMWGCILSWDLEPAVGQAELYSGKRLWVFSQASLALDIDARMRQNKAVFVGLWPCAGPTFVCQNRSMGGFVAGILAGHCGAILDEAGRILLHASRKIGLGAKDAEVMLKPDGVDICGKQTTLRAARAMQIEGREVTFNG